MSNRTTPINTKVRQQCVVRIVRFDDGETKEFVLAPGVLVSDILREKGETRDYTEASGGLTWVNR